MCYNPIGKDDTRGSDVWGLYRDGLYRGKKLKKNEDPRCRRIIENGKKRGKIDHFFITLTWDEKLGMKRPLSILPCCRSVDLRHSKGEIRCSRDKSWEKNITIYGLQKRRKNSMKMSEFSWMGTSRNQIKNPKKGSTQKNQLVLNMQSEKYIYRRNDELWRIRIFQKIWIF